MPSKDLHRLLTRQAKWDEAGLSNPDQSGLRLRLVKIDDEGMPGSAIPVRYRVFAEGAPQDMVFVLDTWPMSNDLLVDPRDMYVNMQGLVMTRKPAPEQEISLKSPGDELDIQSAAGNGEPVRFALASRDGAISIYGTAVGHPVESYDRGCRIEARIAEPGATAVLITINGFPGKTKVPLVLESAGAQLSEVLDTNADGHAVIAVLTTVPGVTEGTLKATAEGKKCLPSIVLPWSVAAKAPATAPEH